MSAGRTPGSPPEPTRDRPMARDATDAAPSPQPDDLQRRGG